MKNIDDLMQSLHNLAEAYAREAQAASAIGDEMGERALLSTALDIERRLQRFAATTHAGSFQHLTYAREVCRFLLRLGCKEEACIEAQNALRHNPPKALKTDFVRFMSAAMG